MHEGPTLESVENLYLMVKHFAMKGKIPFITELLTKQVYLLNFI